MRLYSLVMLFGIASGCTMRFEQTEPAIHGWIVREGADSGLSSVRVDVSDEVVKELRYSIVSDGAGRFDRPISRHFSFSLGYLEPMPPHPVKVEFNRTGFDSKTVVVEWFQLEHDQKNLGTISLIPTGESANYK
jgi:hypothetical protein